MTYALPDPYTQADFYDDVPTKRLVAWVIDAVLVMGICLVALPFTFFLGLLFFPLLWLFLGFLYRWVTLANGSATLGMRLVALEYRDFAGRRFDAVTSFLHTAVWSFVMGTLVLKAVSVALILVTPRRQGLTDLLFGAVAINRAARY